MKSLILGETIRETRLWGKTCLADGIADDVLRDALKSVGHEGVGLVVEITNKGAQGVLDVVDADLGFAAAELGSSRLHIAH